MSGTLDTDPTWLKGRLAAWLQFAVFTVAIGPAAVEEALPRRYRGTITRAVRRGWRAIAAVCGGVWLNKQSPIYERASWEWQPEATLHANHVEYLLDEIRTRHSGDWGGRPTPRTLVVLAINAASGGLRYGEVERLAARWLAAVRRDPALAAAVEAAYALGGLTAVVDVLEGAG